MIDFLLGVPGKLKTISDYLTTYLSSTRAAKIDNLDTAISSRAQSSTALTNATWTDARALKLDAVIQTSVLQSLQSGILSTTTPVPGGTFHWQVSSWYFDLTISAVTVAKCVVLYQSSSGSVSATASLTSPTNLRFQTSDAARLHGVWHVIEFK